MLEKVVETRPLRISVHPNLFINVMEHVGGMRETKFAGQRNLRLCIHNDDCFPIIPWGHVTYEENVNDKLSRRSTSH